MNRRRLDISNHGALVRTTTHFSKHEAQYLLHDYVVELSVPNGVAQSDVKKVGVGDVDGVGGSSLSMGAQILRLAEIAATMHLGQQSVVVQETVGGTHR